jgi:hypothetical protein
MRHARHERHRGVAPRPCRVAGVAPVAGNADLCRALVPQGLWRPWQPWRVGAGMMSFNPQTLAEAGFADLGARFLLWRTFLPRRPGGKPVKAPCSPSGYPVTGIDESGWLHFEQAAALATRHGRGLGIALGWGVCGLDLDRCRSEGGTLSELATRLLRHFPTYVEMSPSGTGVKAYFLAGPAFRTTAKDDARGVELYAGRRFFALTGRLLADPRPLADCTLAASTLADFLRPPSAHRDSGPVRPLSRDARAVLERCEVLREMPSLHGGAVLTLRRCPFTGEEHRGGGPFAVSFADGGVHVRCDRSSHGPRRAMLRAVPRRRL